MVFLLISCGVKDTSVFHKLNYKKKKRKVVGGVRRTHQHVGGVYVLWTACAALLGIKNNYLSFWTMVHIEAHKRERHV